MSPADRDDDIWGTGTESRNPFETDAQTDNRTDSVRQNEAAGSARQSEARDRSRVNMSQGSWGDSGRGSGSGWQDSGTGAWQGGGTAGNGWQNGSAYNGPQGGNAYGGQTGQYGANMSGGYGQQYPPRNRQGGSTAGKVLLVIGIIVRTLLVLFSVVSLIFGGIWSFSYSNDYDNDAYEYSWSYDPGYDYDFGDDSYAFSDTDLQTEEELKDALDDSELEDTSDVLSDEEAAEITGSAVLGLNTSTAKPATPGQWVKTKKTIDGEAYDVYIRMTDMAQIDPSEIDEYNSSQNRIRLIPTSNEDFVDMACTYETYYPEGTPADRHQKDFFSDIVSKQGSFEMKDGTVYRDEELDDVFDITIDSPRSVTREGELFTGRLTYAVTKDCSEYYIVWMDSDAGGRVYIRCTYEQGA